MSEKNPTPSFVYETLSDDTPDALAAGGFTEDELADERRAPAVAEEVGCGRAVRLFYRHYWNDRGTASASEFRWAMIYVVVEELIPESQSGDHSNIATIGVMLGFVIMMIMDMALG